MSVLVGAMFEVKNVLGGQLTGDVEGNDGSRYTDKVIQLTEEISEKFCQEGLPKLHDFTDFFRVGDRFRVILDGDLIVEVRFKAKELRDRADLPLAEDPLKPEYKPTLGYVVAECNNFTLVWANKDGGSLVFARRGSFNRFDPVPQKKDDLDLLGVACMVQEKVPAYAVPILPDIFDPSHPFTTPTYESYATHFADEKVIRTYFPIYFRAGVMVCVLDGENAGSIMDLITSPSHDDKKFWVDPSQPPPPEEGPVYCPPWAFFDMYQKNKRGIMAPWKAYCRPGDFFEARLVYVKEKELAYGCKWMALVVKKFYQGPSAGHAPAAAVSSSKRAKEHMEIYQDYIRKKQKWKPWDFEATRRRMMRYVCDPEYDSDEGGSAKASGGDAEKRDQFKKSCAYLRQLWLTHRPANQDQEAGSSGGAVGPGRMDSLFFKEMHGFLTEVEACWADPDELEEFTTRFKELLQYRDKMLKK